MVSDTCRIKSVLNTNYLLLSGITYVNPILHWEKTGRIDSTEIQYYMAAKVDYKESMSLTHVVRRVLF